MPPRPKPRRVHPPSSEDIARIARHTIEHRHVAGGVGILVSAWSGLRCSETAKLRWKDIRLQPGRDWAFIDVVKGKGVDGGRDRTAILLPDGVAALKLLPGADARGEETPLFVRPMAGYSSNWQSGAVYSRHTLYRCWERARGIVDGGERWVYHDLRKHFATYLLNRGVSEQDVAVALGHLDKYGRPNVELVQQVYGFVNVNKALVRAVEGGLGDIIDSALGGARPEARAASVGAFASERSPVLSSGLEGSGAVGEYVFRAHPVLPGPDAGHDEGDRRSAGGAEGGAGEGPQVAVVDFDVALRNARIAHRASAFGAAGVGAEVLT